MARKRTTRRPSRRQSTPSRATVPVPTVPEGPRGPSPVLAATAYATALALFAWGQFLFLRKGATAAGLGLSAAGLVLALAVQSGMLDRWLSLRWRDLLPAPRPPLPVPVPSRIAAGKPSRVRASALPPPAPAVPPFWSRWTGWLSIRGTFAFVLLVLASLAAIRGQELVADPARLPVDGLKWYLAAVVFFIAGLTTVRREDLKDAPLSRGLEIAVFAGIFVLGAFLRTWRLDEIPSGVFIDMGYQGLGGLRILYERWVPPLHVGETLQAPSLILWQKALWWALVPKSMVGQGTLYLFYALLSLASFPLIYWTFRQLAGPRTALLTLFILAVMRWNVNFSRNAFPPIEMPLYMFGTTAFLLYGLRARKLWSFALAALFFSAGLYTYQAYKAFPAFVMLVGLYELVGNFKEFKPNIGRVLVFALLSFALMWPVVSYWRSQGSLGMRENQLSMYARCKQAGSLQPFLENLRITALMGHRRGDGNPRHNLQDHRMFDDVTGMWLFLGAFWALSRFWKRKYFWALSGLVVMSLPCVLSTDPAHASRMVGTTPFSAFLAASAVAAVWGWVRAAAGGKGEKVFLVLLLVPLYQMHAQNFHTYFVMQAKNYSSWREYSTEESIIGKAVAARKDAYEYYVDPKFYWHYTVTFFTYFQRDHVHSMVLPDAAAPLSVPAGRGLFFGIEMDRPGVLDWLKGLYPEGKAETVLDPNGAPIAHFFTVEAADVDKARGPRLRVAGRPDAQLPEFPYGLPPGPYRATVEGSFLADMPGGYQFSWEDANGTSLRVGGRWVPNGGTLQLVHGFHPLQVDFDVPAGAQGPRLQVKQPNGRSSMLTAQSLTTLRMDRGLGGAYYASLEWGGRPVLETREPVLNFSNGNQFPTQPVPMTARWRGRLIAPASGEYVFMNKTSDEARVSIDGRPVTPISSNSSGTVFLEKGVAYDLDVQYRKSGGFWATYTLQWKRPDRRMFEVVPNGVFGAAP